MQIQLKTDGILYDHDGKLGSNYPDLEPDKVFVNWVQVPGSDYKSPFVNLTPHQTILGPASRLPCPAGIKPCVMPITSCRHKLAVT